MTVPEQFQRLQLPQTWLGINPGITKMQVKLIKALYLYVKIRGGQAEIAVEDIEKFIYRHSLFVFRSLEEDLLLLCREGLVRYKPGDMQFTISKNLDDLMQMLKWKK